MDDIFKKAFNESKGVGHSPAMKVVAKKRFMDDENKDSESEKKDTKDVSSWEDLRNEMETTHAKRFHDILAALPPAQFVDKYLKALEFFKPKVIRTDGTEGKKKDNKVEVVVRKNAG